MNNKIDKSPEKIKKLFTHIAPHYDQNNDIISLFTHRLIKHSVINEIPHQPKGAKILDLCTGTGDIAQLLKEKFPHAEITGVDFCDAMLKIAKQKHKKINFIQGDCTNLPFPNNSFDIITMSFGLRNTVDYNKVISEVSRILRPDGLFVHVDFGKETQWTDKFFTEIVKFIAQIQEDDSYIYLLNSKEAFPPPEQLIKLFASYDLELNKRKDYLKGIISAQYCTKTDKHHLKTY